MNIKGQISDILGAIMSSGNAVAAALLLIVFSTLTLNSLAQQGSTCDSKQDNLSSELRKDFRKFIELGGCITAAKDSTFEGSTRGHPESIFFMSKFPRYSADAYGTDVFRVLNDKVFHDRLALEVTQTPFFLFWGDTPQAPHGAVTSAATDSIAIEAKRIFGLPTNNLPVLIIYSLSMPGSAEVIAHEAQHLRDLVSGKWEHFHSEMERERAILDYLPDNHHRDFWKNLYSLLLEYGGYKAQFEFKKKSEAQVFEYLGNSLNVQFSYIFNAILAADHREFNKGVCGILKRNLPGVEKLRQYQDQLLEICEPESYSRVDFFAIECHPLLDDGTYADSIGGRIVFPSRRVVIWGSDDPKFGMQTKIQKARTSMAQFTSEVAQGKFDQERDWPESMGECKLIKSYSLH